MHRNWGRVASAVVRRKGELGLSQADLAKLSGLSDDTIRKIETGDLGPQKAFRTKTLNRLEEALQMPPNSLMAIANGADYDDLNLSYTRTLERDGGVMDLEDVNVAYKGGRGAGLPDGLLQEELTQVQVDLDAAYHDARSMVAERLHRLGVKMEMIRAPGRPDIAFTTPDGKQYIVEVKIRRPRNDAERLQLIGQAAEASYQQARLVIVSTVDWPEDTVESIQRAGAIFATPATLEERLPEAVSQT